tara:strand:- start:1013 stop:1276 length:264 start_codon:yes stop_codon:yes gene_type:complete
MVKTGPCPSRIIRLIEEGWVSRANKGDWGSLDILTGFEPVDAGSNPASPTIAGACHKRVVHSSTTNEKALFGDYEDGRKSVYDGGNP